MVAGGVVWLYFLGGGKAITGVYYPCQLLGADKYNVPIWGNAGFTCLGPVVTSVYCNGSNQVAGTTQYLNVPAGSYLSNNSTC